MKKKSIILLSGGLDSIVNFKQAYIDTDVYMIINFDYNQLSRKKENYSAKNIAKLYKIKYRNIKLSFYNELKANLITGNILTYEKEKLDNLEYARNTAHNVWVPNRNGLFINIAASYADYYKIDYIIVGFNREEGQTFKDNTLDFMLAINESLKYSCEYKVELKCYTYNLDKTEIVKYGLEISAPFEYIWSCYRNKRIMCGECESCQRLKRALLNNNYLEKFNEINHWGIKY